MVWTALGMTLETAVFVLAGLSWLLSRGYTLSEAGAGAVILVFMAISLVHQIAFYTGAFSAGFVLEIIALAILLPPCLRRGPCLLKSAVSSAGLVRREPFSGLTISVAWVAMACWVGVSWFFADPLNPDQLGIGLDKALTSGERPLIPLNAAALFFHTARFGLGNQACGFGLLAYMAVGLSTYALARRYAWPAMALTVTLLVLSMPRLVFLELRPTAELVSTAAAVYSIVLIYRLVEQHRPGDMGFFFLCTLFSIYENPMSVALVPVLVLLLAVAMTRRHGWLVWRELMRLPPSAALAILPLALGLSQIPMFTLNLVHGHPLLGSAVPFDKDGIVGAGANLMRYLLASIDPTEPIRQLILWWMGWDLHELLMNLYTGLEASVFGYAGVSGRFSPTFSGGGQMGFGPFAILLVLPAVTHALLRGPRRLKATSVAWIGYLYLAALVVAWDADSLAVLTPLYAASGFMVAFSLPPWRLRRRGLRLLQAAFALLLAWSLFSAVSMAA